MMTLDCSLAYFALNLFLHPTKRLIIAGSYKDRSILFPLKEKNEEGKKFIGQQQGNEHHSKWLTF